MFISKAKIWTCFVIIDKIKKRYGGCVMKLRVLLFEDEYDVCKILISIFHRRGYEVFVYDHPQKCELHKSPKCECKPPMQCADILIYDRYYFGEDCFESMKKQKQKGCKAKFYAIMSAALSPVDKEWLEKHNVKLLTKPFVVDLLPEWLDYCEANTPENRTLLDADVV